MSDAEQISDELLDQLELGCRRGIPVDAPTALAIIARLRQADQQRDAKADWASIAFQAHDYVIWRTRNLMDDILEAVTDGDGLQDVVRVVVSAADDMGALAGWDLDAIKRAWVTAGGTGENFPVDQGAGVEE